MKDLRDLQVETLCDICNQWKDLKQFPILVKNARTKIICLDCLIVKNWKWLKHNVSCKHYHWVMQSKLKKDGGFIPDKDR